MRRQVAIIARPNTMLLNRVAAGIGEQSQAHYDWNFQLFPFHESALDAIADAKLDGAIAIGLRDEKLFLLEGLRRMSIPVVHAGELHVENDFPQVTMPNLAIGAVGARHLLEIGLGHFAFVGEEPTLSQRRGQGFVAALAEAGFESVPTFGNIDDRSASLGDFLRQLPRPVGIMTSSDRVGWEVARQAFLAGIRIPDEFALIGVGDEDPWCALASPPLTSIPLPTESMANHAAAMLDAMMNGRPSVLRVDVLSNEVVERQSTAIVFSANPEVAAAIRFIRQEYKAGITVMDVVDFAGISRSTLEHGIKRVLGRTPLEEILRLRFDAAKDLLAHTEVPIKIVATRCGFSDGKHLSSAFQSAIGLAPSEYRSRERGYHPSPQLP